MRAATEDVGATPVERGTNRRIPFGGRPTVGAAAAVKRAIEGARNLVKAEIALAKAEMLEGVRAKALGAGLLVGAAVLAGVASLGLLLAAGFALAEVGGLPGWASALIVSGVLVAIAVVLALVGRSKLATAVALETTKHNVEEDVSWTKTHLGRK